MRTPYRTPGARPEELRPLEPAEEWRLLAGATSRPRWPQLLFMAAFALVGIGMLLSIAIDREAASAHWALVLLLALRFMLPALSALADRLRHRWRRRRLEAEGYDLAAANEILAVAAARSEETLQDAAERAVAEAARCELANVEVRVDHRPSVRVDNGPSVRVASAEDAANVEDTAASAAHRRRA